MQVQVLLWSLGEGSNPGGNYVGKFLFKANYKPTKETPVCQKTFTCSKSTIKTLEKKEIMFKVNTTITRTTSMACLLCINVDLVVLLITLKGYLSPSMQDTPPYYRDKYIFKILVLLQKVDTNCMKMRLPLSISIWIKKTRLTLMQTEFLNWKYLKSYNEMFQH